MSFSDSLLTLAGFAFAHATWSVSDLPLGEFLVPLAIVEKGGQRQLLRFEAESQEQAIADGKATLAEHEQEVDAWVFVREGQINENGSYSDVLTIEAKSREGPSIIFVQRFKPFSSGKFKLLGLPWAVVGNKALSEQEGMPFVARLLEGVQTHSKAAGHWREWSAHDA